MSSLDLIRGRQVIEYMTNQSGVTLVEGDVVVSDGSNNDSITTQAGVTSAKVVGVVQETTLYNGSNGRILTHGYAPRVNVNGSNVTRGHFLFTGAAKAAGTNSARSEGAFGIIRTSGTSPDATIFGAPDAAGGAGGGSGSITASGYTQNTARLLGRTSASAGAIEEITVGSGLSLAAGSITATGGGLVGQPVALAQPLPRTTFATGTNNSVDFGWAHPIIVPASMKVRGFTIEITVDAAGAIEWGLFDYSASASAANKLAGGSAAPGGTGYRSIPATSAPVAISAGCYMLIFKWPASSAPTMRTIVTVSGVAVPWNQLWTPTYTWDDTPDLTSASWVANTTMPNCYLEGDLDGSNNRWT